MASVPSQAFPGEGVRNSRSAPFSLHARGVQLLDTTRLLDGPHQFKSACHSLRDLLSSFYVFLLIQSWLSLYNIIITIASCAFYSFYHLNNSTVAYKLDWTMVAFVIILPMLGFTWLVSHRAASLKPWIDRNASHGFAIHHRLGEGERKPCKILYRVSPLSALPSLLHTGMTAVTAQCHKALLTDAL